MSGDLPTDFDFAHTVAFHDDKKGDITLTARDHRFPVPYGVMTMDVNGVAAIEEKPAIVSCYRREGSWIDIGALPDSYREREQFTREERN